MEFDGYCKIVFDVNKQTLTHIWSLDIDTMEIAWGVDIEPVLAMLSLAFGKNYKLHIVWFFIFTSQYIKDHIFEL